MNASLFEDSVVVEVDGWLKLNASLFEGRRGWFSQEALLAALLACVIIVFGLKLFQTSVFSTGERLKSLEFEEKTLYEADVLLKSCPPQGLAECKNGFVKAHVLFPRAFSEYSGNGFAEATRDGVVVARTRNAGLAGGACVSRIAVVDGKAAVVKACAGTVD